MFKKGQSGNPKGRPKQLTEIRELAKTYTDEALRTLVAVMQNNKATPIARLAAANSILDRGYGKPTQHVEANVNFLDKLSDDEQRALLATIEALAADDSGAEAGADQAYH